MASRCYRRAAVVPGDEVIPLPGGAVPIPYDPGVIAISVAILDGGLLEGKTIHHSDRVSDAAVLAPLAALGGLTSDLASPEPSLTVAALSGGAGARTYQHSDNVAWLAAIRDRYLQAGDPYLGLATLKLRYSDLNVNGCTLEGSIDTEDRPPADDLLWGTTLPSTLSRAAVMRDAALVDWGMVVGGVTQEALLLLGTPEERKEPALKMRFQKTMAHAILLLPSISSAVYTVRELVELAKVPMVADVLKTMAHPLAAGTLPRSWEDVMALPLAPSHAKALGYAGLKSKVETDFGDAEGIMLPSWFVRALESETASLTGIGSHASDLALYRVVADVYGDGGIFPTLMTLIAGRFAAGEHLHTAILEAAKMIGWSTGAVAPVDAPIPESLRIGRVVYQDGVNISRAVKTISGLGWCEYFPHSLREASSPILFEYSPGASDLPPVALKRDLSFRAVATPPQWDPLAVRSLESIAEAPQGALVTPGNVAGLVAMMSIPSMPFLRAQVERDPAAWAHLVALDSAGAVAPAAPNRVFMISDVTRAARRSVLYRTPRFRISAYARLSARGITLGAGGAVLVFTPTTYSVLGPAPSLDFTVPGGQG